MTQERETPRYYLTTIAILIGAMLLSMSAHGAYADHDPVDYLSSGWNNSVGWHDETTFNFGGIDFGYRATTHTYAYGDGTLYFDDVEGDFAYPTGGGEYGWWAQYYLSTTKTECSTR